MRPTVATATGREAVNSLRDLLKRHGDGAEACVEVFEDLAVSWDFASPWVTSTDDGDVLIVLDGRLHDLDQGHHPTPVDALYERYGRAGHALAEGLLGDFVIVVLDRRKRTLLVCRDPLGVRPWYQAQDGGNTAGATDVATLCLQPWTDDSVDEHSAIVYLAAQMRQPGRTFHRGIATLLPGHTWRCQGGRSRTWPHHVWKFQDATRMTWDEAGERCRAALDQAVRCRVAAFGGATSQLSGGLDSSAVVGTAVLLGASDVLAGRLIFDGASADERHYSDAVAEHWGIDIISARGTETGSDDLHTWTGSLHRPPPDPHFMMFLGLDQQFAAAGRRGVLTGLGGDDAFMAATLESRVISSVQLRQRRELGRLLRQASVHPRTTWRSTLRPTLRQLAPWVRRTPPAYISASAAAQAHLDDVMNPPIFRCTGVRAIDERAAGLTDGYQASVLEDDAIVSDLSGQRQSHPFLDPRLIEATYTLDPWFASRNQQTRALQAHAYADRLPESVRLRRDKAEFSEIFFNRGIDEAAVSAASNGPLAELGWLDHEGLARVLDTARQRWSYAAIPLGRLLALDVFLRQRVD